VWKGIESALVGERMKMVFFLFTSIFVNLFSMFLKIAVVQEDIESVVYIMSELQVLIPGQLESTNDRYNPQNILRDTF
jgi:hypothetical protein